MEWADELLSKMWNGWMTEWIPLRIRLMTTRAPAVLKMFRKGEKSKRGYSVGIFGVKGEVTSRGRAHIT